MRFGPRPSSRRSSGLHCRASIQKRSKLCGLASKNLAVRAVCQLFFFVYLSVCLSVSGMTVYAVDVVPEARKSRMTPAGILGTVNTLTL